MTNPTVEQCAIVHFTALQYLLLFIVWRQHRLLVNFYRQLEGVALIVAMTIALTSGLVVVVADVAASPLLLPFSCITLQRMRIAIHVMLSLVSFLQPNAPIVYCCCSALLLLLLFVQSWFLPHAALAL